MKKIFKYTLEAMVSNQEIEMPRGAEILSVQTQREDMCIWAMVNPGNDLVTRHFRVHGTGHDVQFSKKLKHIGTVQMLGGSLIWHVFEVI